MQKTNIFFLADNLVDKQKKIEVYLESIESHPSFLLNILPKPEVDLFLTLTDEARYKFLESKFEPS